MRKVFIYIFINFLGYPHKGKATKKRKKESYDDDDEDDDDEEEEEEEYYDESSDVTESQAEDNEEDDEIIELGKRKTSLPKPRIKKVGKLTKSEERANRRWEAVQEEKRRY